MKITKEYLEEVYVVKKWSTVKIAKEFNCDPTSINYRLKKYGIKLRNLSESHLSDYKFNGDYDVLYGSLLGDASLLRRNGITGQGSASFSKSNIGYDHVCFVGSKILNANPEHNIREGKNKNYFKLTTRMCEEFLKEYEKWYVEGQKIVPKDLKLTPVVLLHWFMDDGHSAWKHKKTTSVHLNLSTESFTKDDCEFLISLLENCGIQSYLMKSHGGYGYKIAVRCPSVGNFFNFIGDCPSEIPSMKYKWKIPSKHSQF